MKNTRGGKGGVYLASKLLSLGRARELSAESAEYLGEVVRDTSEDTKHRVAAARCLVAHGEWHEDRYAPELSFVRLFGDPEAALRYLAENRERLMAMLGPKRLEEHHGRGDQGSDGGGAGSNGGGEHGSHG